MYQKLLSEYSVDALLIENPINIFYITKIHVSSGKLLIDNKGICLFVDARYFAEAKKSKMEVKPLNDEEFLKNIPKKTVLGFDSSNTSYDSFLRLQKLLKKKDSQLKALNQPLKKIRAIKKEEEIFSMKKACRITCDAFDYVPEIMIEGITEKQLAKKLEIFCLEKGADKWSFDPIVAFGKNSACPHHYPDDTKLKQRDVVLIDMGVSIDAYCSDMTRCFFYKENPYLENMYNLIIEAHDKVLQKCKVGVKIKDLDLFVREFFKENNVEEYFTHSLGHGIGLEVHEYPVISSKRVEAEETLQEGMVITLEPGLYFLDKGGVRYENMIKITQEGYEIISQS